MQIPSKLIDEDILATQQVNPTTSSYQVRRSVSQKHINTQ